MLTIVCLSHAEDVANRATRGVADDNHAAFEHAVTDDASFTLVLARAFDLDGCAFEYQYGIVEIEAAIGQGSHSLRWIASDTHRVIVYT